MNTRSSTAAKRCPMTVESSTVHTECATTPPQRQAKVRSEKGKEKANFTNDLKRKHSADKVDEEQFKKKLTRVEKSVCSKDDLNCGVSTRSNVRPSKRTTPETPERAINVPESLKLSNKGLPTGNERKKRQWESWAPYEKDCFFEALNEHGKDFDKIQLYLKKRRNESSSAERNKDQVRHFYYRTLNKISKYIPEPHDSSDGKKANPELRSLICYGEIRKRFRSWKEKDGKKLTELIATGKTTFRHNGRNVNIRAPTCRALKKLSASVAEETEQLPQKIMIELTPSDNKTWGVIQGLSHNPRLRTTVSTRKTLSGIITFLRSKWKLPENVDLVISPCHNLGSFSKHVGNESNLQAKQVSESCVRTEEEPNESTKLFKDKEATSSLSAKGGSMSDCPRISTRQDVNNDESKYNGPPKGQSWNLSNCGSLTIASIFRKMNNPCKISLNYTICQNQSDENVALEHLVKLAIGEVVVSQKKDAAHVSLSKTKTISKEGTAMTAKTIKITKVKAASQTPKPLAPKPAQEAILPTLVHPSIIHQVSNVSSRSGNHRTFGFTPIDSLAQPSPVLPKSKKRQKPRVVVQRTLLPRPGVFNPSLGVVNTSGKTPVQLVSSPADLLHQNGLVNKVAAATATKPPRKILPKESVDGETGSSATPTMATTNMSVDSLIELAMGGDASETIASFDLSKTLGVNDPDGGHVHTEEIDSGIAPSIARGHECPVNDTSNTIAEDVDSCKANENDVVIDHLKSSEDEDPFKYLSNLPNLPPETEMWLNEESTDFSLGALFSQFESSPVKQKSSNVLDTPKKAAPSSDSDSKNSNASSMFCDVMDENSVDYIKKFRDLARKMGNEHDSSCSDNGEIRPSVSFNSLLSETNKN